MADRVPVDVKIGKRQRAIAASLTWSKSRVVSPLARMCVHPSCSKSWLPSRGRQRVAPSWPRPRSWFWWFWWPWSRRQLWSDPGLADCLGAVSAPRDGANRVPVLSTVCTGRW